MNLRMRLVQAAIEYNALSVKVQGLVFSHSTQAMHLRQQHNDALERLNKVAQEYVGGGCQ